MSTKNFAMIAAVVTLAFSAMAMSGARAAEQSDDYIYTVKRGDTVIGVSQRQLTDPLKWRVVARHNRMKNPHRVRPGERLRIPLALARNKPSAITVAHVEGDVKSVSGNGSDLPPAVLALGSSLSEGAEVLTGTNGYATLKMADGSTVRVQSSTRVQVKRLRSYPEAGILESAMDVAGGRIESWIQKLRGAGANEARHNVNTPMAQMGVRGTAFRVTMDTQANVTRGEVLEGAVDVSSAGGGGAVKRLAAGYGSVVDASEKVSEPVALLAAPDTAKLPVVQERVVLRFRLDAVVGAKTYRAQLARDKDFNAVLAEVVSKTPEIRFANIPDGGYSLRVRAIDSNGLEGRNAIHAFKLKARPEPPLVSMPATKGKVRSSEVEFKWAENQEAASYHFQLSRDAEFGSIVREEKAASATNLTASKLALGEYFWRVASVRKDGDHGPYGDVSSFSLFAPPAKPEPPAVGDDSIAFRWSGEPGQKFEFQFSADAKFAKPIVSRALEKPAIEVPRPGPGAYFMRFRAIDPDGFVGPYSSVQKLSIDPCLADSEGRCVSSTYGIVKPSN
jgi:hypothetical protein